MFQLSQTSGAGNPPEVCIVPKSKFAKTRSILQSRWTERYAELVGTAKIAMIDDEVMNIEVVQGYLEQEGYQNFFRTTDATKALDLIRTVNPDVVLLDVMMPEISGLEILAAMRRMTICSTFR